MSKFADKRRQQFLPESYYKNMSSFFRDRSAHWKNAKLNVDESDEYRRSLGLSNFVDYSYLLWSLRFTGGEPFDVLRDELENVIAALEFKKKFDEEWQGKSYVCPLFAEIDDYERVLQLISAAILFHREDLISRIAVMFDPVYKRRDTVYEKLVSFRQDESTDVDVLFYKKPYTTLVQAMRAETKEKASDTLKRYCKEWYPGMKKAPWHDSHLRIEDDEGFYVGYWAFEAGAVAYLYELDDSKIDHMVYPRALVEFARKYNK